MLAKRKFFYGWVVAACCVMLAFSINAMGNNSMTFYVTPVSEAFGISRTTMNFALFTTSLFAKTLCGFFYGSFVRKFGVKKLMVVGGVFAVSAYLIFSQATGVAFIVIGAVIYGIAHSIGTFSAYNAIINNWFVKRKGLMLGIVNTSVGLGGMVINPLVGSWIQYHGWNASFLYTGLLIGAIALPALCLVKIHPSEKGEVALGSEEASAAQADQPVVAAKPQLPVLSLKGAMHTYRFWLLAGIQLLQGFALGPSFSNVVPNLNSLGIDPLYVSGVLAVILAFGGAVGNITSGLVYDRFGLRALYFTIGSILLVGMVAMSTVTPVSGTVVLIISVLGIGYGNPFSLGTLSHLINTVFGYGRTDFSALFGWLFALSNAGNMIGAPFSGWIYDVTGSYQISYIISACCLVAILCLIQVAISAGKKAQAKEAIELQ